MKPLVIYHGNCADGFGAAWCFHYCDPDAFDFHPGVYGETPPDCEGREVYMVDFSYKRPVVEAMCERARGITWIDHHKTAWDDLFELVSYGRIVGLYDVERSGAALAWRYLFGDEHAPKLISHIEDRDLWRFALPLTREIQACVFSHPYNFEVWDELMASGPNELANMAREGAAIERKHHKDIAELLDVTCRQMEIGGYIVPVANLPYTLVSDAAHTLAHDQPFAGCYWDTPKGRVFGLRSEENGLDVGEIAKQYGGGGHKHAAGFTVPYGHPLTL